MTSAIYDFKSLNRAARLQDGGDDHYAPETPMVKVSAWTIREPTMPGVRWTKLALDNARAQAAVYQPVDAETYAADEIMRIAHMAANCTPSVESRLMSIMTNASILRGSPESKASNLMRLLDEQGLRIVECSNGPSV
jgi:hypothetical protein